MVQVITALLHKIASVMTDKWMRAAYQIALAIAIAMVA